jgi:hypothetical protein
MTQPTTVSIQLVLTIEIPGCHPIRIDRRVPITLGRTLEGKPMHSLFDAPGTQRVGAAEVDLRIEAVESLAPLCTRLSLATSSICADGILRTVEIYATPQPKSPAYTQLELIQAKYRSETTDALNPIDPLDIDIPF